MSVMGMMKGRTVLVTGGTKGIGRATVTAFAEAGARVFATYKWGSADTEEITRELHGRAEIAPVFLEADASNDEDTKNLLERLRQEIDAIDVFVSNVAFGQIVRSLDEYQKRSLYKTCDYSSWPLVAYTLQIRRIFAKAPRYVVGISSDAPDHFYPGYDFIGASKALLEFFAKYLAARLLDEDSRVNVIRFGAVATDSFRASFGKECTELLSSRGLPAHRQLSAEDCGRAVLALCSGLLDAVHGQVLTVDHGAAFVDNSLHHYVRGEKSA
jgi:NAD(P)-dependent dehydrogenase (short-subunit alcohol dehydrogenase family)